MRSSTLAGMALAISLVGMVGCARRVPPPAAPPSPVDPEIERKREAARYQERIVMDEVARTHPVLSAAIKGDLEKMRQELAKAPKRINEVRRDMRLGPPLREACRRRWEPGITELMNRGAKCLGDAQCEACVRSRAGGLGVSPSSGGTGYPSGTGTTGGYRSPSPGGYPVPRPSRDLGTAP